MLLNWNSFRNVCGAAFYNDRHFYFQENHLCICRKYSRKKVTGKPKEGKEFTDLSIKMPVAFGSPGLSL